MLYRVLTRQDGQRGWRAATPQTSDLNAATVALQRARRFFAEALLVEAETANELATRVGEYCRIDGHNASADDAIAAQPLIPLSQHAQTLDARRWELERGPGGDHDEPYVFALPASLATLRAWGRLLARAHAEHHILGSEVVIRQ